MFFKKFTSSCICVFFKIWQIRQKSSLFFKIEQKVTILMKIGSAQCFHFRKSSKLTECEHFDCSQLTIVCLQSACLCHTYIKVNRKSIKSACLCHESVKLSILNPHLNRAGHVYFSICFNPCNFSSFSKMNCVGYYSCFDIHCNIMSVLILNL